MTLLTPADIFTISGKKQFIKTALQVFRYQYENNIVYRDFCNYLNQNPSTVRSVEQIPFLPISFFKLKSVISGKCSSQATFTSSGTTGEQVSSHHVIDLDFYKQSYISAFQRFYGSPEDYIILALLPSYLERSGSSLVYMVDDLIKRTNDTRSGFYLNNHDELRHMLQKLDKANKPVILFGVSFALLDLADSGQFELQNTIVIETGGMKGRREEIVREALHETLCKKLGVPAIHSEYGMTELLSQAYSFGHGIFECPPWMQVFSRDPEDALSPQEYNKTGGLNIIDLANVHSCSFIATQDLGKVYQDGRFEVLGRFDHADLRGCNLLVV